jgi:hypothetical protein
VILLISASYVGRIADLSHCAWPIFSFDGVWFILAEDSKQEETVWVDMDM